VFTSAEDARYLINAVNETFPTVHLTMADVESSWAGLRPLIHEEGKSASELSRKDEIFESPTGLVSIAGGKLTGYRKMAERVVDLVIKNKFDDRELKPCSTESLVLSGFGLRDVKTVQSYERRIVERIGPLGLRGETAATLVHLYGTQADFIIDYMVAHRTTDPDLDLLNAELWYVMNQEMIVKAQDFLVRRTGLLFFDLPRLIKLLEPALQSLAHYLNWDEDRLLNERLEMEELIRQTLNFKA
jgi:glycerol-3-phosphate dehydrogenase